MSFRFQRPSHFPDDCPPQPYEERPGIWFRLFRDASDPEEEEVNWTPPSVLSKGKGARCRDLAFTVWNDADKMVKYFESQFQHLAAKEVGRFVLPAGHGGVIHLDARVVGKAHWWLPAGQTPKKYYAGKA